MKVCLVIVFFVISHGFAIADTSRTSVDTVSIKQDTVLQHQELMIDTAFMEAAETELIPEMTAETDTSVLIHTGDRKILTNTEIFIYILLSVLGLGLFFFIFVQTLFKTFHKTRSTRQSLLLSWNLFFLVSLIWLFIVWGIVAEFLTSTSFTVSIIFLLIISLIMLITAIKSKN